MSGTPAWRERFAALRRPVEWSAGLAGSAAYLAGALTQGLLAFGALGPAGLALGMPAALTSAVVGGGVLFLLARGPMPAGGPSSSVVLVYGAMLAGIAIDPAFAADDPGALRALLALGAFSVVLMGVLQVAAAAAGLARLVRYVPQPALAGFMNGVAVLLLLAQLPAMLGVAQSAWMRDGLPALADARPWTFGVAVLAAALYLGLGRARPRWPGALVALVVASALFVLLESLLPPASMGPRVGALAAGLWQPEALRPLFGEAGFALLQRHAGVVVAAAAVMAVVGALENVLLTRALDQAADRRTPPGGELAAYGAACIASGLVGGLPVGLVRSRARPTQLAGGRTPAAVATGSLYFAVIAWVGAPLIGALPLAVLAGIMAGVAVTLVDDWTRRLLQQWRSGDRSSGLRLDLAIVALVCLVTLAAGFVAGVVVGVVASMLHFIAAMNRSLVRARGTAASRSARRLRPPEDEALLRAAREGIELLELEGALFFGSADRLAEEVLALPPTTRALLLDLRRVSRIDASGALVLAQLQRELARRGVALRLAGVGPHDRHGRALRAAGVLEGIGLAQCHDDLDAAIEAAEDELLTAAGRPALPGAVALADSALLRGLPAADAAHVAARMTAHRIAAGARVFSLGDAGDSLYVLVSGSVSIVGDAAPGGGRAHRYLRLPPGMMFGEAALLDGGGRSAHAVADVDSVVRRLAADELQRLQQDAPALAAALYRRIAMHLAERLRQSTGAWRESVG